MIEKARDLPVQRETEGECEPEIKEVRPQKCRKATKSDSETVEEDAAFL
jgi:hypothetical protein